MSTTMTTSGIFDSSGALIGTVQERVQVTHPVGVGKTINVSSDVATARIETTVDMPRAMMRELFGPLQTILAGVIGETVAATRTNDWNNTRCVLFATPGVMIMYSLRREREMLDEARMRGLRDVKYTPTPNGTPLRRH